MRNEESALLPWLRQAAHGGNRLQNIGERQQSVLRPFHRTSPTVLPRKSRRRATYVTVKTPCKMTLIRETRHECNFCQWSGRPQD